MPGPTASSRRRRTTAPKNVPPTVATSTAPKLPTKYARHDGFNEHRIKFLATTREWWDAWVERGEAAGFGATDWIFARDVVAPMVDLVRRGGSVDRARELRMQLAVLEQTAKDRAAALEPAEEKKTEDESGFAAVLELISNGA